MDKKYEHILNLPRPVSTTRPRMSLSRRAAQFAPFAALTGFEAMVDETARQTEAAICLDEGEVEAINRCLQALKREIANRPAVFVRFFRPDERKEGGSFEKRWGQVVKIDETLQEMLLQSGEIIQFRYIVQLMQE
jgi:hypothetical protein